LRIRDSRGIACGFSNPREREIILAPETMQKAQLDAA